MLVIVSTIILATKTSEKLVKIEVYIKHDHSNGINRRVRKLELEVW